MVPCPQPDETCPSARGVWHARLEDVYQQSYVQLPHSQPVGDWVLGANLGYVTGKEEGAAKADNLDNKVYLGALDRKSVV